jgi:acetylglutamate kinase
VHNVALAQGYRFAGIHSGLKVSRKDMALIVSDLPASAAAVLTRNQLRAACADRTDGLLPRDDLRAILVSSGNANCLSGPQDTEDDARLAAWVGESLGVEASQVVTASTGGIGKPLPMEILQPGVAKVAAALEREPRGAAEAMLTTDKTIKLASREVLVDGTPVVVTGLAKGSGMINPEMATMLAFLLTDAKCEAGDLQEILRTATGGSFNQTTVDQDTSTNDMALLLANGAAGVTVNAGHSEFVRAVSEVCEDLARMIAADGEGATRLIGVEVCGAPSLADARQLGRAIVSSSLFKASLYGDASGWPRLLAALGAEAARRGLELDRAKVKVAVEGVEVFAGHPTGAVVDVAKPEVSYRVELGLGDANAWAWGCDLGYDYVSINAVTKSDPLETHSPGLKRRLLVEALSYIRRFKGSLAVIKYGGAAMLRDDLKDAFAEDLMLLEAAGLRPVVVHGGGPEISRTLGALGEETRFVDGIRVTDETSIKIVEMVLTGRVNTDLVTRIQKCGGRAVGISGKDGGLLVASKLEIKGKELGLVGEVKQVNTGVIELLLDGGYIPVISPVGVGEDGQTYNINADTAASRVAQALGAEKLIFISDVSGVLDAEGQKVSQASVELAQGMLADGTISGGMIPKVEAMLEALKTGVRSSHLVDGRVAHNLLAELFTDRGVGTWITQAPPL